MVEKGSLATREGFLKVRQLLQEILLQQKLTLAVLRSGLDQHSLEQRLAKLETAVFGKPD